MVSCRLKTGFSIAHTLGSYDRAIHKLPVILADHGIHLRALVDLPEDKDGHSHKAGDEWQLKGPLTYIPQSEVVRYISASGYFVFQTFVFRWLYQWSNPLS